MRLPWCGVVLWVAAQEGGEAVAKRRHHEGKMVCQYCRVKDKAFGSLTVWQKFPSEEEAKSFCDENQDCIGYHLHPHTKILGDGCCLARGLGRPCNGWVGAKVACHWISYSTTYSTVASE
ncbi:unnamed protein product [Durusdinium trenchii]|uniref:Uncharacterized protein n=1 Tax=Durusdinium trenchii TaxID=1381693 RepID=A0ABP0PIL4_9DINO